MKKLLPVFFALFLLFANSNSFSLNYHPHFTGNQLIPPHFPGGEDAFHRFLGENLKWPQNGDRDLEGTEVISFFVESDGQLTNFKVEKSLGAEFDKEVLRVMAKSPKWIPAKRDGKSIRSKYSAPFQYSITE
jgi:periplasmic protein TonB